MQNNSTDKNEIINKLPETDKKLLLDAYYVRRFKRDINSYEYKDNSSQEWDVEEKLDQLKRSDCTRENSYTILTEAMRQLVKQMSMFDYTNRVLETFNIEINHPDSTGQHLFMYLSKFNKKTNFRLRDKTLVQYYHSGFISVYLDFMCRTLSVKGEISFLGRAYKHKTFTEHRRIFIPYAWVHQSDQLMESASINWDILSEFYK